ncbi:MAG: phosphoglycerate kinase [Alphaproteobacteria bacterium]|nr:phosphoglycerate kinase [Alphaproteobacteria bacterium]
MAEFKTLDDLEVSGKRVLVRADLNVPMKDGAVSNATRIERLVPTLSELAGKGARVIVASHFGRPKGKKVAEMSLKPLAGPLGEALGKTVAFAEDCIGEAAAQTVDSVEPSSFALLENLRFHAGEEANDPDFASQLAANADLYVNDAFSCAHRAHASTHAVAELIPACAGRLMEAELSALAGALEDPQHPAAAIVGGAKISTKLDLLGNLCQRLDVLAIGGAMANTFLHAQGMNVGKSLCEHDMAETARAILGTAQEAGCEIVLPVDAVVADELAPGVATHTVDIKNVPAEAMILDIGPQSAAQLAERLEGCKSLVWNGPLGAFETPPFDAGTNTVAVAAAGLTRAGKLVSVAGGGDTVAALSNAGVEKDFTYISTAGGAFLEWLEGKELPGVAALSGGT